MSDGNLRQIFKKHLPEAMWVPVETWSTGRGVPDSHYVFPGGHAGWIEFKLTKAKAIKFQPGQIAWHEEYSRMGGLSFIAVRKKSIGVDEIWLYHGSTVRDVFIWGLKTSPIARFEGGPSRWDWIEIKKLLTITSR